MGHRFDLVGMHVMVKSYIHSHSISLNHSHILTRDYPEVRGQIEYLFYLLSDINKNLTS